MAKFLQPVDNLLNRFTMYKVVLYGLIFLLAIGCIFGFTGAIAVKPVGLLLSTVILGVVCYVSNQALARLYKVPANSESYLITALILACILPQATSVSRALAIALTGIIAMASKYILLWKGSNIFNPAAIAAVVVSVAHILPVLWWIGSPPMALFTAIVGFLVLRKQRNFRLFFSFAIATLLIMLLIGSYFHSHAPWFVIKDALLSWPLLFFATIMLTEPSTLPADRFYQVLYGVLVGVVFASQLHAGRISATPQMALVVGNIFTLLVATRLNAVATLKKCVQLTPNTYELIFAVPKKVPLTFIPGQYLEWTLAHKGADIRGNRRTFSIASSPTETELRIGIKHYQPSSTFKNALVKLKPGDSIRASHLGGNFTLPAGPKQPVVCIAGGIGITPFRSQLKYLTDKKQPRDITLFYVAASANDFVYKDVLTEANSIGLTTHYVTDKLESEELKQGSGLDKNPIFYVSGPNAMVQYYADMLHGLGVPAKRIRTDHFAGY